MNKYKKLSEQRILKELMEGNFLALKLSEEILLFKISNYVLYRLDVDTDFKWIKTKSPFWRMESMTNRYIRILQPEEVKAFIKEMKESA